MTLVERVLTCGIYILLGRWLVGSHKWWGAAAFALLNLATICVFVAWERGGLFASLLLAANLVVLGTQYLALRLWSDRAGLLPWLAFMLPIGILVFVRYIPIEAFAVLSSRLHEQLMRHPDVDLNSRFIGLSYIAFRTSYLVLEIRNRVVKSPGFLEYAGFALFAPTLLVGPISPYSEHHRAFSENARPQIAVGRASLRVLVGGVKYKFFGPLLSQLGYSSLLLDGHLHPWTDLPVAMAAYYLFLYCNFSGFCDIAIGAAGLMGLSVAENFDNPFAARNLKDFWNRWHITLSRYMRDVLFSPLSKGLLRVFGPAHANHSIALTILVVFLVVGVWHGVGWNYAAFGLAHALGVMGNHYYTILLKKQLGKERFAAYKRSRAIQALAVSGTFIYVAATLFLFANDWDAAKNIFSMLRAR